ncbi:MAG: zinc ribbon domain-containing protein [Euryarchaeota archaeon]|nr:zinc ribbon domain-containing protein [Euryarchaeota archaeon]
MPLHRATLSVPGDVERVYDLARGHLFSALDYQMTGEERPRTLQATRGRWTGNVLLWSKPGDMLRRPPTRLTATLAPGPGGVTITLDWRLSTTIWVPKQKKTLDAEMEGLHRHIHSHLSATAAPPAPSAVLCPACRATIPRDAAFCGKCRADLRPRAPPPLPGHCTSCGAAASPGTLFCPACGAPAG